MLLLRALIVCTRLAACSLYRSARDPSEHNSSCLRFNDTSAGYYTALVSLLFGTVIRTSFNILILHLQGAMMQLQCDLRQGSASICVHAWFCTFSHCYRTSVLRN